MQGEGIGVELVRIIRQIHQARKNIASIEQELTSLRVSEIAQLKHDVEAAEQEGRDRLAELATTLNGQISQKRKEHEALAERAK